MYVILLAVILIVIILFWDAIKQMLLTMQRSTISSPSYSLKNGYIWFFCLLGINIILVVFILSFYYYKVNEPGISGIDGISGLQGLPGNVCMLPDCSNNTKYENE